ncbi:MAG: caspase family protein, partial [Methanophagales archaeon]|nr:caspase family protein [Methanophagales archaeon]
RWNIQRDVITPGMICDENLQEDWDEDRLTNINELMQSTNPLNDLETDSNNLSERYAVIASGVNCYGCSANVLEMYHLLKKNGYDDNHVVLFLNHRDHNRIYPDEDSNWGGDNEWKGKDLLHDLGYVVINYENSDVTVKKFLDSIVNLPTDDNDEILIYYSGHGCGSSKPGDAAFALSTGVDSISEAGSGLEPEEKWHGFCLQGGWLRHYMLNEAIDSAKYARIVVLQDGCATGEFLKDLDKTDKDENFDTGVQTKPIRNTLAIGSSWWGENLPEESRRYHFRGWGHYFVNALKIEGCSILDAVNLTRMAQDPVIFYFDEDVEPIFNYDHTKPDANCPWGQCNSPILYLKIVP